MPEQLELQLPYEEITKVLSRADLRKNFSATNRVAYWIPFNFICEREGFNRRQDYGDIRSLADYIAEFGLPEPFVLDVVEAGKAYVDRGHRRFRAINLLIEEGKFLPGTHVEFFPNNSKVTELQRMIGQYTSNNLNKQYTPLEQSGVAFSAKYYYGMEYTNEEVAKMMNVSRQTVDNLIIIAEADDSVKESIRNGDMSMTNAVAFVRSQRKAQKQANKKEEESHKTSSAAPSLPIDELRVEMKELKELENLKGNHQEKIVLRERGEEQETTEERQWVEWKELDEENEENHVAPSVITEPVAEAEKPKFDSDRPEIALVQKSIQGVDKLEAIVTKLDVPDDVKKDIAYQVYWLQRNLSDLREWVHANKKQNKGR